MRPSVVRAARARLPIVRAAFPRSRRSLRPVTSAIVALTLLAVGAGAQPAAAAGPAGTGASRAPEGDPAPRVTPSIRRVTLITGDVVRVITGAEGREAIALEPGPDGRVPQASIRRSDRQVFVVPRVAMPLLAAGRLDHDLFDVKRLIADRRDDARSAALPLLVDYGRGVAAGNRAQAAKIPHARKVRTLEGLGAAAFAARKTDARAVWRALTADPDATGAPTALAGGARRIDLDGRVHTLADPWLEQIGAPAAWAAGFDGTGTTVAVLDTGYDPTHPDLAGQVAESANFSTNPTVVDGNGHGTHTATTLAGTGAASGGTHGGVAPGVQLLIGKVLDDSGFGEDSAVLAGMEWAVEQGADVVSMSLGGDASDGGDPLSQAIDELSASSDTLFVVAAGNAGSLETTITSPGAADAALTVGAVDGTDQMAWFSSRGPRLGDGAVKPDVVAPGVDIVAGRAAGTGIGSPVDDLYTALSGTSMATPQVAGLAAILKQAHPGWDGERLKAVIAGSTDPIPFAGAFDAGSGRIDAARAIVATVVAPTSVNLGFFPWPHAEADPSATTLTYRNLDDEPITLDLSLAAQDGDGPAPDGVALSDDSITVPADGTATVDLLLDPSVAGTGSFSGVVTAQEDGGSQRLRTAFGFALESEHYDLTVRVVPRPDTQRTAHDIAVQGAVDGSFVNRTVTGAGQEEVTFRVVPGIYGAADLSFALADDGGVDGVLAWTPRVHVTADTVVTLDGADARLFDYAVERPVLNDGQVMTVSWIDDDGFTGFGLAGGVDRLYVTPSQATGAGQATGALNWVLSQPDAELTAGSTVVPLRAVAAAGQSPWAVRHQAIDGAYPVANGGDAAAPLTRNALGAVVVLRGHCGDLTAAVDALADAGAVAVVATQADGASCAGTVDQPAPIPTFQARPFQLVPVLDAGAGRIVSHRSPSYVYDLAAGWDGSIPDGATLDGRQAAVGTLVEQYDTLGGSSDADGLRLDDVMIGWLPGRDSAPFGLVRPARVPGSVTHYVSPAAAWERLVQVSDADGIARAVLTAPRIPIPAGKTVRDRWFHGPISSRVSPRLTALGIDAQPNRQGDTLNLYQPEFVDDAGHYGGDLYSDEFDGRVYLDGDLLWQADSPLWLWGDVPAERHDYRVVFSTTRANAFWRRSTPTRTAWTFSSRQTDGLAILPLIGIDYDAALSATNTAAAGRYAFGLRFAVPKGATPSALRRVRVDVSWNGGRTWRDATVTGCDRGDPAARENASAACRVSIVNKAGRSASLRVVAIDAAGRTVRQTIVDAWRVR